MEQQMTCKTMPFKFKIQPTPLQEKLLYQWSDATNDVWNAGRKLLIERQCYLFWETAEKNAKKAGMDISRCEDKDVFYQFYVTTTQKSSYIQKGGGTKVEKVVIKKDGTTKTEEKIKNPESQLFCSITWYDRKSKQEYYCCPLPLPVEPKIKDFNGHTLDGVLNKYPNTTSWRGGKLPTAYFKSTLALLATAWKEYKKPSNKIAAKPKFKEKEKNKFQTLAVNDSSLIKINLKKGSFVLPGSEKLGELKILGNKWRIELVQLLGTEEIASCKNETRFTSKLIRTAKIIKDNNEWYVYLAYNTEIRERQENGVICGIDLGLKHLYTDDVGKTIDNAHYYRKAEKKLARLQRKAQRQEQRCKLDGVNRSDRKNLQKTYDEIRKLHGLIAKRRKAYLHKQSSFLVERSDLIVHEDLQIANLMRRPKPKKNEDGNGYQKNNAAAKSGLNKSFADAGLGAFISMVKQKGGDRVIAVDPSYTSQACSNCGAIVKKSLSQRTHECPECGFVADRDHNAAINIKALFTGENFVEVGYEDVVSDQEFTTNQNGQFLLDFSKS